MTDTLLAQKAKLMDYARNEQLDKDEAASLAGAAIAAKTFSNLSNTLQSLQEAGIVKSRAAFKVMQGLQISAAIANTYASAVAAYNSQAAIVPMGPYLGAAAAAAAIAAGMANVAQIRAQTFHTGGVVGPTGNKLRSDEVPAILQTGEMILNRNEVKQAQAAPTGPSETVIINSIDPAVIESYMTSRAGRKVIRNVINA